VFVTTSSFRKGAKTTAKQLTAIGYPVELMDAERFLGALGIAQFNSFDLDQERYAAYVLSRGVHLGSGRVQEFVSGENLVASPVVARVMLTADLIDLYALEAPNPYEASLCQETNEALERCFAIFSAFRVLA